MTVFQRCDRLLRGGGVPSGRSRLKILPLWLFACICGICAAHEPDADPDILPVELPVTMHRERHPEFCFGSRCVPNSTDGRFVSPVFSSGPDCSETVAETIRVVVLGDSITKGVRSGVTAEQTFASLLQAALSDESADPPRMVEVINLGIGGERTDQALARLGKDVISLEPRIVTVMYGTNDSYVDQGATATRITADEYAANLKAIVHELRHAGIMPVLMTEPRWGDKAAVNGLGEHPNLRLEQYVNVCRMVAESESCPLVDHFQYWSEARTAGRDIGEWTTDQCHPNPEGHKVLADRMLPVLRSMMEEH